MVQNTDRTETFKGDIPSGYDHVSTFQHNGKTHFLVNRDTKFGILDLDGNEVVEMIDAVNRLKLSKEVKQMFEIVFEYSLHREESQQLLLVSFGKLCSNCKKTAENQQNKMVLYAIFYDFIAKCYCLSSTKETLLNILTDTFVGIYSPFQEKEIERGKFSYSDVMERLIDIINDNEWFINFFTDYINEIMQVSMINNTVTSLETIDWEQCIITYLMGVVAGESQKF